MTLEQDVERTLARLITREQEIEQLATLRRERIPRMTWEHPTSAGDARSWLERLLPLLGDTLAERLDELPPDRSLALLPVVATQRTDAARAAVITTLERSYLAPRTSESLAFRAAAARALSLPMPEDAADRLATETIRLIDESNGQFGSRCGGASCDAVSAVEESVAALERASRDREPIERVRARIAQLGPRTPLACTPTDEDLAISAAVRALISLSRPQPEVLTTSSCIDVEGPDGRVVASRDAEGEHAPIRRTRLYVGRAGEPIPLATGHSDWDAAPQRTYGWSYECGSLCGSDGRVVVARIDGIWRAIEIAHEGNT